MDICKYCGQDIPEDVNRCVNLSCRGAGNYANNKLIEKAKKLARYTEGLAETPYWGVDDQDTLEWLISQFETVTEFMNISFAEHRKTIDLLEIAEEALNRLHYFLIVDTEGGRDYCMNAIYKMEKYREQNGLKPPAGRPEASG